MTNPSDYLDAVRQRVEAATGGEYWHRSKSGIIHDEDCGTVADVLDDPDFGFDNAAEFIAHAPEDVGRLLAAVEAMLGVHQAFTYLDATFCAGCWDQPHIGSRVEYPCPTVKAAWDALGDDQ